MSYYREERDSWQAQVREGFDRDYQAAECWRWLYGSLYAGTLAIYRIPFRALAADLRCESIAEAKALVGRVFAVAGPLNEMRYDPATGDVWVVQNAAKQHDRMKTGDKRLSAQALREEVERARTSPFWAEFLAAYRAHLHLGEETTRPRAVPPVHVASQSPVSGRAPEALPRSTEGDAPPSPSQPIPSHPRNDLTVVAHEPACAPVREAPVPTVRPSDPVSPPVVPPPDPSPAPDPPRLEPPLQQPHPEQRPPPQPPARLGRAGPVALAVWQMGTLEDRVRWLDATPGGDREPALASLVGELRAAVQRAWTGYRSACEDGAGREVDPEAWDAIARAVLWLAEARALSPSDAADRIERLTAWARAVPALTGRDVRAWRWPLVLFGRPIGSTANGRRTGVEARLVEHWNACLEWERAQAPPQAAEPVAAALSYAEERALAERVFDDEGYAAWLRDNPSPAGGAS